jgi:hypothetical protein
MYLIYRKTKFFEKRDCEDPESKKTLKGFIPYEEFYKTLQDLIRMITDH